LATEIQGTSHHSIVQHDELLLAQQACQDEEFETALLATDLQRSVLHALKPDDQRRPIAYSSYGYRHPENGLFSLLGFNGERPDSVTGYYPLGSGYRAFNPALMRFSRPDSWSPFGQGGLNSYAYCLGDPVNFSDPTGHGLLSVIKSVKNFFGPVATPVVRNVPAQNSLEGIGFDAFREITKNLSRSDMDNLAQVSWQLKENSTAAGMNNLHSYLASHAASGKPLHSSMSSSRSVMSYESSNGRIITVFEPPLRGVGSAAFKELHPGINGSATLVKLSKRVRLRAAGKITKAKFPDSWTDKQKLNSLHASHLSSLLIRQ
jgi:RHS repeat-associated protein